MAFIAWVELGLIAGYIASKVANKVGEGLLPDMVLGIVGSVIGGYIFQTFGMPGVSGINLYSLLVAVVGAVLLLMLYHALIRRGPRA